MNKISVVLPVLVPAPFLQAMTEFCIKTLRLHADNDFDLIVVEAEHEWMQPGGRGLSVRRMQNETTNRYVEDCDLRIDKYINFTPKIGGVNEINAGIRAAETEFVVVGGNDVIVPPHWDTELLKCFSERKDCGIAALSAFEPGTVIGPPHRMDMIVEGMYSPFSMWRKETNDDRGHFFWEYDTTYLRVYQDSDIVMRMYEAGFRAYRSCRAHVHHLLRMTNDIVATEAHNLQLKRDEELFYRRWGDSPLAMFGMIRAVNYGYAREYKAFTDVVGYPAHPANRRRV